MEMYRGEETASVDFDQVDDMKKAGWTTTKEPQATPDKTVDDTVKKPGK